MRLEVMLGVFAVIVATVGFAVGEANHQPPSEDSALLDTPPRPNDPASASSLDSDHLRVKRNGEPTCFPSWGKLLIEQGILCGDATLPENQWCNMCICGEHMMWACTLTPCPPMPEESLPGDEIETF